MYESKNFRHISYTNMPSNRHCHRRCTLHRYTYFQKETIKCRLANTCISRLSIRSNKFSFSSDTCSSLCSNSAIRCLDTEQFFNSFTKWNGTTLAHNGLVNLLSDAWARSYDSAICCRKMSKMDILLQCYNLNVTAEAYVHRRQKSNR